jgi:hypothetical protein
MSNSRDAVPAGKPLAISEYARRKSKFRRAEPDAQWLTRPQAAAKYGWSTRYLERLAQNGNGPPFSKFSSTAVKYHVADLDQWAASRKRRNTSAAGEGRGGPTNAAV